MSGRSHCVTFFSPGQEGHSSRSNQEDPGLSVICPGPWFPHYGAFNTDLFISMENEGVGVVGV
jgi:hypothetical protein